MRKNLQFTFRMLRRNPLLVFIGLPSLAVGLVAILLLVFYLNNEFSFDQHFKTKDRVVRLFSTLTENGDKTVYGIGLRKAYTEIPERVPEIEAATQILRGWQVTAKQDENRYSELNLLYADPGFFQVFGQNLLAGNPDEALQQDHAVVLSRSTAMAMFQSVDCVGQSIIIADEPFVVTGVIDDLPPTTHFQFDLLASMKTMPADSWGSLEFYTYYLIYPNADPTAVGRKIAKANDDLMTVWNEGMDSYVDSGVELLRDIHLHTKVDFDLSSKANLTSMAFLTGIALFILVIALINFLNLYVLHTEKRITEIASRKALGADQKAIRHLFFGEAATMGVLAFLAALVLLILVQPLFAQLMQTAFSHSDLLSPRGVALALAILLLVVLVAGAYPAFYLSRIKLVPGLKGKTGLKIRKNRLSLASVVVQFSITVFLISSLFVVHAQVSHLKEMPLGFEPDNVWGFSANSSVMASKYKSIEADLKRLPFVTDVVSSSTRMGGGGSGQAIKLYGSSEKRLPVDEYRIHSGFGQGMQLHLQNGRFFRDSEADKTAIVLNESAVQMLGEKDLVGRQVDLFGKPMEVIGVVDDFFHVGHPGEPIAPLVLTNYSSIAYYLYVRVNRNLGAEELTAISRLFKQYDPDYIVGAFRLTDYYYQKFEDENRTAKLVASGTWLAIFISFMGLLSLSLLQVNRRRKEIGIRKVVGSSVAEVMYTILREYLLVVLLAVVIAVVPAFWLTTKWLQGFSEQIELNAGYFFCSGLAALLIALLAVSWQSWRAATRNPVEALRYE